MSRVIWAELEGILPHACYHAHQKPPACCQGEGKGSKEAGRSPACCSSRRCIREEMPNNAQSGACESSPAERAHGPPRGVEQYSASRGDLTELEASRSIAPSSVAGRADGEALAARQVLCARMGFWPFVRRPPSGVCETLVRGQDWVPPRCRVFTPPIHTPSFPEV